MSEALTMDQLRGELQGETGTQQYHRHFTGGQYTDGVAHMAERAEAYWLLDVVFSYQCDKKIRAVPFQVWTLKVLRSEVGKNKSEPMAVVEMREDKDAPVLVEQKLEYTDFPGPEGEFQLWLIDGILILPSEY